MCKINKPLVFFLAAVLAISCFIVCQSTSAQSVPKPSVPEFTVTVTDQSYDVPTTTTTRTDFDGRKITTTTPGYHVKTGSIEISIKNQIFTPYYDSEGYPINLYYHLRVKLLNNQNPDYWRVLPELPDSPNAYFEAANSTYTTVIYRYLGHDLVTSWGTFSPYRPDGTIDFQVEAFIGHTKTTYVHRSSAPIILPEDLVVTYVGQGSGWSNTQTAIIPNGAYVPSTPKPLPTSTPTSNPTSTFHNPTTPPLKSNNSAEVNISISFSVPLTTVLLVVTAFAVVIAVLSVLLLRKNRNQPN